MRVHEDIDAADSARLRDLARRLAELAADPVMSERRRLWLRHNALEPVRPLVYIDPQGSWAELLPDSALVCHSDRARGIERDLRRRIYTAEHFASDNVLESTWTVRKTIQNSGWGLEPRRRPSAAERGAFGFDPVIHSPEDLRRLRFPEIEYDPAATQRDMDAAQEIFGGILDVRVKGIDRPWFHLMNFYTALRGLDQVMLDMHDNPAMLHDAMAFLEEGNRRLIRQYTEQGLLSANNDDTPIYTSGHGYSDELAGEPVAPQRLTPAGMWGWAEAQEMAQVSPDMHREFVFEYEKRLLAPFGLAGYGCCDDLTRKLDFVLTIPRLRRVSISPWANVDACAARLRGDVIFMWKPQPAHLVGHFDPAAVRQYLRHTVEAVRANGGVLELVLLDTHTCENHPERFDEWSRIAHEEALRW